jgi:hypothetical protein
MLPAAWDFFAVSYRGLIIVKRRSDTNIMRIQVTHRQEKRLIIIIVAKECPAAVRYILIRYFSPPASFMQHMEQ